MLLYLTYKIFQNIQEMKLQIPSIPDSLIVALIGGVAGALTGALVHIWFTRRQSKRELKSLIIAFVTELALAFERCVLYYKQAKEERKISFSSLFDFTGPSMLSRLAAVINEPDVVAAIIDLKSIYFQIRRQVEDAAGHAAYATRLAQLKEEQAKYMEAATKAQHTALGFFLGREEKYKTIVEETAFILDAAKKISPGKVVEDLEKKFTDAQHEKFRLDGLDAEHKRGQEKQNKS